MKEQIDQLLVSNQAVVEALAQVIGQQKQMANILKELEKDKEGSERNTKLIYQAIEKQSIHLLPGEGLKKTSLLMQKNIDAIYHHEKILKANTHLKFLVWGWGFLALFLLISLIVLKFEYGL